MAKKACYYLSFVNIFAAKEAEDSFFICKRLCGIVFIC